MRAPLAAAVLLSLVLAIAACGDDDERGTFTSETGTGTETTGTGTTGAETTGTTGTTGTTPEEAPSGKASKKFSIGETEFELQPASFELASPGVVVFVVRNAGQIAHALEVEGPTGEVETESIEPGQTARLKADVSKAGRYKLYCPIGNHEAQGMVGTLVVGGGTGGAAAPTNGHGGDGGGDDKGGDSGNSGSGGGSGSSGSSGGDDDGGGTPYGY